LYIIFIALSVLAQNAIFADRLVFRSGKFRTRFISFDF